MARKPWWVLLLVLAIAVGVPVAAVAATGSFSSTTTTPAVKAVNSAGGGSGVYGLASAGSSANTGVYGRTQSTTGRGVFGLAAAGTGVNFGVAGQSNSTSGRGVSGLATAPNGAAFGVIGQTLSVNTLAAGLYGYASSADISSAAKGVWGRARGGNGVGVFGSGENDGLGVLGDGFIGTLGLGTAGGVVGDSFAIGDGSYGVLALDSDLGTAGHLVGTDTNVGGACQITGDGATTAFACDTFGTPFTAKPLIALTAISNPGSWYWAELIQDVGTQEWTGVKVHFGTAPLQAATVDFSYVVVGIDSDLTNPASPARLAARRFAQARPSRQLEQ